MPTVLRDRRQADRVTATAPDAAKVRAVPDPEMAMVPGVLVRLPVVLAAPVLPVMATALAASARLPADHAMEPLRSVLPDLPDRATALNAAPAPPAARSMATASPATATASSRCLCPRAMALLPSPAAKCAPAPSLRATAALAVNSTGPVPTPGATDPRCPRRPATATAPAASPRLRRMMARCLRRLPVRRAPKPVARVTAVRVLRPVVPAMASVRAASALVMGNARTLTPRVMAARAPSVPARLPALPAVKAPATVRGPRVDPARKAAPVRSVANALPATRPVLTAHPARIPKADCV